MLASRLARPIARPIFLSMVAQRRFILVGGSGSSGGGDSGWSGGTGWRSHLWSSAAMAATSATMSNALCASQEEVKEEQEKADFFIDTIVPLGQQLSMGSCMGYASGYALRVVGQLAAFSVGVVFMALQGASYAGYVDVNWKKTTTDLKSLLDFDGSGEVDANDFKIILHKFIEVCTFNLPSGAGFTAGMALGLGFGGGTAGKAAAVVGTASLLPRVLMMGGATTAGSGVMMTIKETYDAARRDAGAMLDKTFNSNQTTEDAVFATALKAMDLESLRNMEKGYKMQMDSAKSSDEKTKLQAKLAEIEGRKKALKRGK